MKRDLGTYHLRVEFADGRGFIDKWHTGTWYIGGTGNASPLSAERIPPGWDDEDSLFGAMLYQYTEGNYSCDCNRALFLARAHQQPEPENVPCGETIELARLTAIRPDGTEDLLYSAEDP